MRTLATRKPATTPTQNGHGPKKNEPSVTNELPITGRQRFVAGMNLTAPEDILRLRELLSPEYETLAARQNELLNKARGQYVLIHQEDVQLHPSLDSAMEDGYTHYANDLFFVGRIDEQELKEYLST